jgi:hypothetical protein
MQTFPASAYHLSYVAQGRPCFLLMHHGNDLHRSSLARSAHDPCADARTNTFNASPLGHHGIMRSLHNLRGGLALRLISGNLGTKPCNSLKY